jgi:hypothetical protein
MVKYIECNKEKLPVSISYYAISKLEQETGKGIGDIGESLSLFEPLFFYALEAGFRAEKKDFNIKREDVAFMLDDCWLEFSSLMTDFYADVANHNEKKLKK